jgi:hypothetical protein
MSFQEPHPWLDHPVTPAAVNAEASHYHHLRILAGSGSGLLER